jgi:hypothetical protein
MTSMIARCLSLRLFLRRVPPRSGELAVNGVTLSWVTMSLLSVAVGGGGRSPRRMP